MKAVWGKESSQQKEAPLQFCSDCCSDAALGAFWRPLLQLGQGWALLSSCRHVGSLLPGLWGGCQQYSSSHSHWDPPFSPLLTRGIEKPRNSSAAESPVWMWGGGCCPPGGGCLSFAFLDQIFLRENSLEWLRALLFMLGRAVPLLCIFYCSLLCIFYLSHKIPFCFFCLHIRRGTTSQCLPQLRMYLFLNSASTCAENWIFCKPSLCRCEKKSANVLTFLAIL